MSDLRITWDLPAIGPRQLLIEHVLVYTRVSEELPWAPAAGPIVPDTAQEVLIVDIDPGVWFVMVQVIDTAGAASAEATASVDIDFDPPGAVLNLALTVVE